jgi:transposase
LSEDEKTIQELREEILVLRQQLDWFKRQLFGRKGEQFEHPELFEKPEPGKDESSDGADAPAEDNDESEKTRTRKKRKRAIRSGRLPEDLPRVSETVTPPEVLADPDKWKLLSEEERTWLEKEPGHFYLRVKVYQTYVPLDGSLPGKAVTATAPPTIIDSGFWGESLLAEVLCNRYLYHLPYARQESLYKNRFGIDLSRKTMSDAAGKVADQLVILTGLMKEDMLQCGYIRADETEVRYLDRDAPGGSSRGRFWVYKGANGDVLFDWQLSREHHHFPDWIGEGFEGVIGSDGYEAYPKYCRAQAQRGRVVERAACHAHIRRKYEAALKEKPKLAGWFLKIYGKLYQIEATLRECRADCAAKERYRQRHSQPLLHLLDKANKHLLQKTKIRPKSRLGEAVRYALGQWSAAPTYLAHGQVEIDNNAVERDIRPSAVGKKNWLFVGSPDAGDRSAVFYSLLISARHHGVDPEAYLRDVLKRLPGSSTDPAALRELLPANWAAAHKSAQATSEIPAAA